MKIKDEWFMLSLSNKKEFEIDKTTKTKLEKLLLAPPGERPDIIKLNTVEGEAVINLKYFVCINKSKEV